MKVNTTEQLKELVTRVGDESLLEQTIYNALSESFREKLRELPPPPEGYYYRPVLKSAEFKNGEYTITSDIVLQPIISEEK